MAEKKSSVPNAGPVPKKSTASSEALHEGMLVLEVPAAELKSKIDKAKEALSPKEKRAIAILDYSYDNRKIKGEAETNQLLQNEAFLIQQAAERITGVSVYSHPSEKKFLIAYHLKEFFAALQMPPNLGNKGKSALRHEALIMLLKLCPQDDIERMLLSQLIASHMASMTCFGQSAAADASPEQAQQSLGQAQKMTRLFLDIERAFRQRRKHVGEPDLSELDVPIELLAKSILKFLGDHGIRFDEDDPSS